MLLQRVSITNPIIRVLPTNHNKHLHLQSNPPIHQSQRLGIFNLPTSSTHHNAFPIPRLHHPHPPHPRSLRPPRHHPSGPRRLLHRHRLRSRLPIRHLRHRRRRHRRVRQPHHLLHLRPEMGQRPRLAQCANGQGVRHRACAGYPLGAEMDDGRV